MKLYHMSESATGKTAVPTGKGLVYHSRSHITTKGKGLLLSPGLGGFGASPTEIKKDLSALQNKLSHISVQPKPKKKFISL